MGRMSAEPRQQLQFIGDMLEQLRAMVPAQAGPMLPHLLAMARLEANETLLTLPQSRRDTLPPA